MQQLEIPSFVQIVENIPAALDSPCIVNMSSSLLYISDYRALLGSLANLAPQFFIVSLTPLTDGPTYARMQLNIPHKKIACWVFNRGDFILEMETLGYRIIFTIDHDLPFTHKNSPGPSSFASMVFRRQIVGTGAA